MIGAIIGDIVGSRFEFRNHFSYPFVATVGEVEYVGQDGE